MRATSGFSIDTVLAEYFGQVAPMSHHLCPALAPMRSSTASSTATSRATGSARRSSPSSRGPGGNTGLLVFQLDASNKLSLVGPKEFYTSFATRPTARSTKADLVVGMSSAPVGNPTAASRVMSSAASASLPEAWPNKASGRVWLPRGSQQHDRAVLQHDHAKKLTPRTNHDPRVSRPVSRSTSGGGFATTKSVEAQATLHRTAGPVKFKITAVDSTASGDLTPHFHRGVDARVLNHQASVAARYGRGQLGALSDIALLC